MQKPPEPELSTHICPECNGPMWFAADGKLFRYQCRIGHAFSGESLLVEKTMALESALWSAVNALKDKADIATKLAKRTGEQNGASRMDYFTKQASDSAAYAKVITEILLNNSSPVNLAAKPGKSSGRRQDQTKAGSLHDQDLSA